jgi:hypothetical protein
LSYSAVPIRCAACAVRSIACRIAVVSSPFSFSFSSASAVSVSLLALVAGLRRLAPPPVLLGVLLGLAHHAVDVVLGQGRAACRLGLDAQGQRGDVEQQHVLGVAADDARLERGAQRSTFVTACRSGSCVRLPCW